MRRKHALSSLYILEQEHGMQNDSVHTSPKYLELQIAILILENTYMEIPSFYSIASENFRNIIECIQVFDV